MKRVSLLIIAMCMSVLVAGVALAQDETGAASSPRREAAFKAMDANGDGKITKEEYLEHVKKLAEKRFAKLDTQGKGYITKEEFLAKKPRKGGKSPKATQPQ